MNIHDALVYARKINGGLRISSWPGGQCVQHGMDNVLRWPSGAEFNFSIASLLSTDWEVTREAPYFGQKPPESPPRTISFFANGQCCVGDSRGRQMGMFNGTHGDSIRMLKVAGYDWRKLDVWGCPNCVIAEDDVGRVEERL